MYTLFYVFVIDDVFLRIPLEKVCYISGNIITEYNVASNNTGYI